MRRKFRGIAAGVVSAVVMAATLTACATSDGLGAGAGGGAAASTLSIGQNIDITGWNPSTQPGHQSWAHQAVWDQLVMCNAVGELEPGIATEWEVNEDNSGATFTLREGVTFSDGTPLDAQDVKDSFQLYATEGTRTSDYEGLDIEIVDSHTITLTWPEPQVIMYSKLCDVMMMPSEWIEAGNFDHPVGSGPYTLDVAATTMGSVYAFNRNADHWDAERHPFERLYLRVFANSAAAVSALKTGQIDATLVPEADVATVESAGFSIERFRGQTARLIIGDRTGSVVPALGDVRVRQAMNMIFDRDAMVANLYNGNAEPAFQVFRPGTAAYIEGLENPYPYDVARAQELMAEAGWADGFTIELPVLEGQNHEVILPYVIQQLELINIEVEQVPLTGPNWPEELLGGRFPVIFFQLGNLANSAFQIYIEATPAGWWNVIKTPNDFIDSRFEELRTADAVESRRLQQEINHYLIDNAWFAPLAYLGGNFAYSSDNVSIPTQSDQEASTPMLRDFRLAAG